MITSQNYITDNSALQEVIELISETKIVALDTEFMREKTYYPILSLIQIGVKKSGEQKLFVVDALANIDLAPLFEIIFDRKITKILHASLQDLQIFYRESKIPTNGMLDNLASSVIDTQIMANFCGFNFNSGYSTLTEILLNQQIDKTMQRSDWQRRPLSAKQIEYAASDVFFLEEIHQKLSQILEEKGREKWYAEEMKIFLTKSLCESKENLFKNFSFKGRSPEQVFKMKSLILWREDWSQKLNLPRQHFIRDQVLERMAYQQEIDKKLSAEQISEIEEIFETKFDESGKVFAKEEGKFMSDRQKNIYKKAKELLAEIARQENLKEQFLITSQGLKNLICTKKGFEEVCEGWRYNLYGERLKQLIINN